MGNLTRIPSLKQIKKASKEYRKKSNVNMYVEEKAFIEGVTFILSELKIKK